MSYRSLLRSRALIQRVTQDSDEYGTPQPPALEEVDNIPCAVSRQTISATQGAPMVETGLSYRLYFLHGAPIQEGDLAVVQPYGKFRLAAPYPVRGHHIEVDGTWEGEA